MLNINEQRKAINYASMFLRNEVADLNKSIRLCSDEDVKKILKQRLSEIEPDLELFQRLGDDI